MATYAVGDLQGCFDELNRLLKLLNFQPSVDRLWFVGDLVNRGPKSLETLRFVKNLGEIATCVLGNHDLHLLAVHAGLKSCKPQSRLNSILRAPDGDDLIDWLRHRPLMHHDSDLGVVMVHAGLPPQWDLTKARALASELEHVLQSDHYVGFLAHMYGDRPDGWSDHLRGWDRLRVITNGFTRLRYCDSQGRLDMKSKGPIGTQPEGLIPWFEVPNRRNRNLTIIFGHWAALGHRIRKGLIALDSGCIWGGRLTAVRLDSEIRFVRSVRCPVYAGFKTPTQLANEH
jgi:bis(5'-nucleosyl)-tetraphosphatase (symmetrical)